MKQPACKDCEHKRWSAVEYREDYCTHKEVVTKVFDVVWGEQIIKPECCEARRTKCKGGKFFEPKKRGILAMLRRAIA